MNIRFSVLLIILVCVAMLAAGQDAPTTPQPTVAGATLSGDALDQLLKPIALYPDPLLAEIFTAATLPAQIVEADRYVNQGGDVNQVAQQPWDPSVQGLVHYPTVLKWLDDNLAWATDVGQAFLNQQQDVMDSIQRLRGQAQAEGNLQSTPQENVVADAGTVEIEPTDPAEIYVPSYSWDTIYTDPGVYCTFGAGFAIGPWLGYDWDWRNHHVIAWGAGHPRPGDWWRRAPGSRTTPRGVPTWHPTSRAVAGVTRGPDRGYNAETYRPAHVNVPKTPAPREGLQARPETPARASAPAAGLRPPAESRPVQSRPTVESRPPVEARPPAQIRAPVVTRSAPVVREAPGVSAFGGPDNSAEARQSSARGVQSRGAISAPASAPRKR